MVQVSFDGRTLHIEDQEVELDYPIQEVIVHKGKIVVLYNALTDPLIDQDVRENIEALSPEAESLWTIDPITTEQRDGSVHYVGISLDDGDLIARNWTGASYVVDPETGSIEYHSFSR